MVDLDEPRLQVTVDHDVEAEDVEARLVLYVVWQACAMDLVNYRLTCYHGLHDQIINVLFEKLFGFAAKPTCDVLKDAQIAALMCTCDFLRAVIVPFLLATVARTARAPCAAIEVAVLHVVFILFVDRVVRQVHKQVLQLTAVAVGCRLVRPSGEPGHAVIVDVDLERIDTIQEHVQPQVKLEAVYEQRVVEVSLRYLPGAAILTFVLKVLPFAHQMNSATLAIVTRLHDEGFLMVRVFACHENGTLELRHIRRQHKRLRKEIEFIR